MEYIINIGLYELIPLSILFYNKLRPEKVSVFAFLLLFLFAALSFDVGWDYIPYRDSISSLNISRYEFLEKQLMLLSYNIGFYQLFFIVNHFLIFLCVFYTIKNESIKQSLSILIFICFPFMFLTGLSTIRSGLSSALIFFAAEKFLKHDKLLLYLLAIFACFFIHQSSILGLLIIPCYYFPLNSSKNFLLLVLAFIFGSNNLFSIISGFNFGNNDLLLVANERYDEYVQSGGSVGTRQLVQIIFIVINLINLICYKHLGNTTTLRRYITYINIGCCFFLLFRSNAVLASRFSRIFYLFVVLIIPYYLNLCKLEDKGYVKALIIGVCFVLFAYQLCLPNYNGVESSRISTYWPYRFFFFN